MHERVLAIAKQFTATKVGISKAEAEEIRDLLLWLAKIISSFWALPTIASKAPP